MSTFRTCCLIAVASTSLLMVAGSAGAHETLPMDWCTDRKVQPKIVAKFEFNGDQLNELVAKCGIVEAPDDWHTASEAIAEYCEIVAPLQSARPLILGPDVYLGKDHHKSYQIEQGLTGVCAVCERE